jgi:CheY-like chemotaxis protein
LVRIAKQGIAQRKHRKLLGIRASTSNSQHLAMPKFKLLASSLNSRDLLVTILEQSGAQAIAAASAERTLYLLSQSNADVLVSDIGMPNIDGYTLMKKIRNLEASQGGDIPAIALTAYARDSDRIAALEAGFQVHLPKPFNSDELVEVVAKLTGRKPTQSA